MRATNMNNTKTFGKHNNINGKIKYNRKNEKEEQIKENKRK